MLQSSNANGNRIKAEVLFHFSGINAEGLLRDSEAVKALFEKVGLFKAPELLEKYVIASEVTVEVLDLFLSRVFGTERGSIDGNALDLKPLLENLGRVSLRDGNDTAGEDLSARSHEPNKEEAWLCMKVENLERQLCAVQRQLQMQGDVSQLAVSLGDRLNEIKSESEMRVSDVISQVSAVREDIARLSKDVSDRASTGDVKSLSEDVLRLKGDEWRLDNRISDVEKATEAERVLGSEI